jgi:hypothetical protein
MEAQTVLWSPKVNPTVILVASTPSFLASSPTPLHDETDSRRESAEGVHALHCAAFRSQLLFLDPATHGVPLAAVIPLDSETLTRIEALTRFWRSWRGRPVPADTRVTQQQRRRMRFMMQAIDGRTDNASYREIAIALYGDQRIVAEPWKTSSLRDAVIGLVEGATDMIGGGYFKLLRHRRR